jgi:hypothetical protein
MDSVAASNYSYLAVRMRRNLAFLRYLAVKRHKLQNKGALSDGDGDGAPGCVADTRDHTHSIFVAGIPFGLHRVETLKQLFAAFGEVSEVAVHQKQVKDHYSQKRPRRVQQRVIFLPARFHLPCAKKPLDLDSGSVFSTRCSDLGTCGL